MEYTSLVDALVEKSEAILLASEQGNIDFINREAENRLSLVNILEHIQDKIDLLIPQINDLNSNRELLELLKVWLGELEIWSGRVQWIDNQIYDFLNAMKEELGSKSACVPLLKTRLGEPSVLIWMKSSPSPAVGLME